jgi:hypothetical protein
MDNLFTGFSFDLIQDGANLIDLLVGLCTFRIPTRLSAVQFCQAHFGKRGYV